MSIKAFYVELKDGLKSPAYLLHSEEVFFLKEALSAAKKSVPEPDRDFLYHVFDIESDSVPIEQIIDVLYTMPLMGGRKVVAIEGFEKISEKDAGKIAKYLSAPSPDSALLLLVNGKLKKAHKLEGAGFFDMNIRERDIPMWVRDRASRMGLKFAPGAVECLIGAIGPDVGLLSSELEKLSSMGMEGAPISAEDVLECVRGAGGYTVFSLTNALKAKDLAKALRIYGKLSETLDPLAMLGAINWSYGTMTDRPKKAFEILHDTDLMLKSSSGTFPLELMLYRLLKAQ